MSIPLMSLRLPPFPTAKTFEFGLSVVLLGWLFRGAVEFAIWTLEFAWR